MENASAIDRLKAALSHDVGASVAIPDEGEGENGPLLYGVVSDEVVDGSGQLPKFSCKKLWAFMGPGFLMSLAYLDPGNLASDLQCGAVGGYSLIWVLWWATALGLFLQCLAVRIGVVTGKHMAELCTEHYPRWISLTLFFCTELAIIGSDVQEVIGSAIALRILFGLKLWIGCLITGADTFTFLLLHSCGMRVLEALFASLIGIMAICFGIEMFIAPPNAGRLFEGWLVPRIEDGTVEQAVGMVGAVIMPHALFLQSALVLSRVVDRTKPMVVRDALRYNYTESAIALLVSFFINLFIVSVFSVGFFGKNLDIGLREAGDLLAHEFGNVSKYIWAIGLLAAGQASTMTGTMAGQYVMAGFINLKLPAHLQILLTRSVALVPALLVAVVFNEKVLDSLDELINVIQSVQLPFALLPLIVFNSSAEVMGGSFWVLSPWVRALAWLACLGVVGVNVSAIINFVSDPNVGIPQTRASVIALSVLGLLYVGFVLYVALRAYIVGPFKPTVKPPVVINTRASRASRSRTNSLQ